MFIDNVFMRCLIILQSHLTKLAFTSYESVFINYYLKRNTIAIKSILFYHLIVKCTIWSMNSHFYNDKIRCISTTGLFVCWVLAKCEWKKRGEK